MVHGTAVTSAAGMFWCVFIHLILVKIIITWLVVLQCPGCEVGHGAEHSRNFGYGHVMKMHTRADCAPTELREAPTPVPNPVLTPTPAPDREATPTPAPVVHNGIICDMCQDTVIGVRHKCLDCPGKFLLSRLPPQPVLISGIC